MISIRFIFILSFTFLKIAYAEDLSGALKRVMDAGTAKDFPRALKELQWAQKELEDGHKRALEKLLPASLGTFKSIQEPDALSPRAMKTMGSMKGTASASRIYERKPDETIVLSVTSPMGISAAVIQSKCNPETLKHLQKTEVVRLNGRLASLQMMDFMGMKVTLTVCLKAGAVSFEFSKEASIPEVKAIVEKLDLTPIENYMLGFL